MRTQRGAIGTTIHSARFYDWVVVAFTFGRETRLRERTLDVAGVAAGESVLDIGCGTGTLAIAASRRVGRSGVVSGIDASPEMIDRAREKSGRAGEPVRFEVAPAQELPFADGTFDVVLCSLAVHHFPRAARAGAFVEMQRVLRPNGRVLIVEFGRQQGIRALLHPIAMLHARHITRILDEATASLRAAGFARVDTGALGFRGLDYLLARRT